MTIEHYITDLFVKEDCVLKEVRDSISANGLPDISISSNTGTLLYLLVKISRAKHVLEVGALGGYSGIWLARGLPDEGTLTSLEVNRDYADLAKSNIEKASLGNKVTYVINPALESFKWLYSQGKRFDLFFIDADKENYQQYVEWSIQCANPGALITVDNVLWKGRVIEDDSHDILTNYIRSFNEKLSKDVRLESMILPVGDGIAVAYVKK